MATSNDSNAQHKRERASSGTPDAPSKRRSNLDGDDDDNVSLDPDEAITKEELRGTEVPMKPPKPRDAFSELMARKPKHQPKPAPSSPTTTATTATTTHPSFSGRDGLGAYLADPASFPTSRVIFHAPASVAIHDLFPKATVHCLLLPRSPAHTRLHPFEALSADGDAGTAFLAQVRADAARLRDLVAKELRRLLGRHSAAEARRNAVLDGVESGVDEGEGGEGLEPALPEGRDWAREVRVGVHAVPSMNHLHVHVMSRDMHSERLKHRKHYNSFTTDFFVPLDDFPLARDDPRRRQGKWPERPMVCWRCGRDFGNKFKELKGHLEGEFEEWKRE